MSTPVGGRGTLDAVAGVGPLPGIVAAAMGRARGAQFPMSCDPEVGSFLATLAAAVPAHGRILELGTGAGVGLAWLVHGLAARRDVEVVSVEIDSRMAELASQAEWPPYVRIVQDDALAVLRSCGQFNLVFADAQGGKWEGLDLTVAAVETGGQLVVDDMNPPEWMNHEHREKTLEVRLRLLSHPDLVSVEVAWASGLILSTRRMTA
jgi:predicted O-methyltransferase YrrM